MRALSGAVEGDGVGSEVCGVALGEGRDSSSLCECPDSASGLGSPPLPLETDGADVSAPDETVAAPLRLNSGTAAAGVWLKMGAGGRDGMSERGIDGGRLGLGN